LKKLNNWFRANRAIYIPQFKLFQKKIKTHYRSLPTFTDLYRLLFLFSFSPLSVVSLSLLLLGLM